MHLTFTQTFVSLGDEFLAELMQVSSRTTHASDRVRARQLDVPDDGSLSQCVVLFPRLCHAQHGVANWQAVLECPTVRLVRHRQVHHQSGITQPRTVYVT